MVGTGGRKLGGFGTPAANSEVRNSDTHGVIKFTLRQGSYEWEFVPLLERPLRTLAATTVTKEAQTTVNVGYEKLAM